MNKPENDKKGVLPKLIAWSATIISILWYYESNFEYEPLLGILGGIGGLIAIYGFEQFEIKTKISDFCNRTINSTLSIRDIVDIINTSDFEEFKSKVKKFKFEQTGWQGENSSNQFTFDYKENKKQHFYHSWRDSYNAKLKPIKIEVKVSFYSFKSRIKRRIVKSFDNMLKDDTFELVEQDKSEFIESKTFRLQDKNNILLDKAAQKDFEIEILYKFSDYLNQKQFSLTSIQILTYKNKEEINTEANKV